ncbi:hypothetical protein M569_11408, partial [Genlisea aurea]
MVQPKLLVISDDVAVSMSAVLGGIKVVIKETEEKLDPLIITQASADSLLSVEPSSLDGVVALCKALNFPSDELLASISGILKPSGTILLLQSQSSQEQKTNSSLERKLLLGGFIDVQSCRSGVIGKKSSWKMGSSFSLKKVVMDDLIDEDTLLTEEDLKKPQVPSGDCEVGKTRKACKNCSCGRAEAEEKVEKLGL